jgi:hypothetical protein
VPMNGNDQNEKDQMDDLPGHELVSSGLNDLAQDRLTEAALVVLTAAPRLRRLGFEVPVRHLPEPCEHLLYALLEERFGTAAHSRYNSLIRRITSFSGALEREKTRLMGPP